MEILILCLTIVKKERSSNHNKRREKYRKKLHLIILNTCVKDNEG